MMMIFFQQNANEIKNKKEYSTFIYLLQKFSNESIIDSFFFLKKKVKNFKNRTVFLRLQNLFLSFFMFFERKF